VESVVADSYGIGVAILKVWKQKYVGVEAMLKVW